MARRLILGLGLAVIAVHLLVLQKLSSLWQEPTRLKAMAVPLFTRELRSSLPPLPANAHSQVKKPVAQSRPAHLAANLIAKLTPTPSTSQDTSSITRTTADPQMLGQDDGSSVVGDIAIDTSPKPLGAPSAAVTPALSSALPPVSPVPAITPTNPPAPPPLDDWPLDTRLSYALSGNYRGPITGDARVQWTRDGNKYQVLVEMGLSGVTIFSMTSQGLVTPQGLAPSAYEEKRLGTKALQVALDAQQVRLYDGNRVNRQPETQDTASQFVELGHRFSTGLAVPEVGKTIQIWLARPSALAEWTYDVVALETLNTPRLGALSAYHLKPRPLANPSGPITAEMWFAPSLQYLPVRIKITMNAETWVDLLIEKIEQSQGKPENKGTQGITGTAATTATVPVPVPVPVPVR